MHNHTTQFQDLTSRLHAYETLPRPPSIHSKFPHDSIKCALTPITCVMITGALESTLQHVAPRDNGRALHNLGKIFSVALLHVSIPLSSNPLNNWFVKSWVIIERLRGSLSVNHFLVLLARPCHWFMSHQKMFFFREGSDSDVYANHWMYVWISEYREACHKYICTVCRTCTRSVLYRLKHHSSHTWLRDTTVYEVLILQHSRIPRLDCTSK